MHKVLEVLGRWLDELSYKILVPLALLLAGAPFVPEPHLVETTTLLVQGRLTEPMYIFDFFMHGAGLFLVAAKITRDLVKARANKTSVSEYG